ncbi:unnamed protein product [Paramecium sonneborni]|uniref:Uncharacterized protein n=1 Tax=Paramecium sonneborni TaxID=65129 RepID=A0A8S1RUQ7_9CILI|nr:unnamed protein product [Paramecium sonneborni]
MFSQAFRRDQQPQQQQPQPLGISFHKQTQQTKSFSQNQYEKENISQFLGSTKRQNLNESFYQEQQVPQISEVYRILEQLQQMMVVKFNDFQNVINEQEKAIRPLIDQNTQLNNQLTNVLQQSEKILSQLTVNLEKSDQINKRNQKRKSNEGQENDLGAVQLLLKTLDDRLNNLSNEVEMIAETNNRFQVHVRIFITRDGQSKKVLIQKKKTLNLIIYIYIHYHKKDLYQLENVLQNYLYDDQEVNNNVGLHCVFATASPVLTTGVKRYYGKLTAQIKAELEKKKQKERLKRLQQEQEAQKQQFENQFNQSTVQIIDDKQVEEKYFEQQIGEIKLQKEQGGFQEELNQEDWEQEEEKLKQELNAFHSFADMKDSDFPAFLTIKKLVLLVDGSLAKPFFSRTQDKKILSSDTHAQWSTENTGVILQIHTEEMKIKRQNMMMKNMKLYLMKMNQMLMIWMNNNQKKNIKDNFIQ